MIGTLFLRPLHHQPHGEPSADPFLLLSLVLGELTNVRESVTECGINFGHADDSRVDLHNLCSVP